MGNVMNKIRNQTNKGKRMETFPNAYRSLLHTKHMEDIHTRLDIILNIQLFGQGILILLGNLKQSLFNSLAAKLVGAEVLRDKKRCLYPIGFPPTPDRRVFQRWI